MRSSVKIIAVVFLTLGVLGIFVLHTRAQTSDDIDVDCDNAITTMDMVACADKRYQAADARLNAVYKKSLQDSDAEGAKILRESQRGWISFRDAECLRYRDMARGGTMAPLLQIGCLADMTENRSVELENTTEMLASQPDGIFWQSSAPIVARFDCKNWMRARLGLLPGTGKSGEPELSVRVEVGTAHIDLPVNPDGQIAVCKPTVTLSVEESKGSCPRLKLEDGACDAIYLSWDAKKAGLSSSRN